MRLEPISERFTLAVDGDDAAALNAAEQYATRRGKLLARSADGLTFTVGSPFTFRLLGTFYEAGRRSVPVKVTLSLAAGRRFLLLMESQERGYFFRAPWMDAAYADRFREIYADLREAVGGSPPPSTD